MQPLIAFNLLQSIHLLQRAAAALAVKCIEGITANKEKCQVNIEQSLAMSTALAPIIGYEKAAAVAKEAFEEGKTVREIALRNKVLPEEDIHRLMDELVHGVS
jgi:fumarate hydratase class II